MSGIGGGAEALRGFPSLINIDPLRKNIQGRGPISKPTLVANASHGSPPATDYHLDVPIFVGQFKFAEVS